MSPRRTTVEHSKGVFEVEWPLFGELSRGLRAQGRASLRPGGRRRHRDRGRRSGRRDRRHSRSRVPLDDREPALRRRHGARDARGVERGAGSVRDRRVLVVDETCDTGDTMRLAVAAMVNAGASEVRTAVAFQTGSYAPDFHALATESTIVLPWDREVLDRRRAAAESALRGCTEGGTVGSQGLLRAIWHRCSESPELWPEWSGMRRARERLLSRRRSSTSRTRCPLSDLGRRHEAYRAAV